MKHRQLKQVIKYTHKYSSWLIAGTAFVVVVFFFAYTLTLLKRIETQIAQLTIETNQKMLTERAFQHLTFLGTNVVIYDATHDTILFQRGATTPRPLASISKIMTALVARNILAQNTPITITSKDRTSERDTALRNGDTWKTADLMQYSLMSSSNDGMTALCNAVSKITEQSALHSNCISLMNQYAENHGLTSMLFQNPTGLDIANGVPSNSGSALDVAKLLHIAYGYYPDIFGATNTQSTHFKETKYTYTATNTNEDIGKIQNMLAGKTGYTDVAGGNLAVLYMPDLKTKIVIVVLGSSHEGRFSDMLTLVDRTNIYLKALQNYSHD